jgi:hypothetical protein
MGPIVMNGARTMMNGEMRNGNQNHWYPRPMTKANVVDLGTGHSHKGQLISGWR